MSATNEPQAVTAAACPAGCPVADQPPATPARSKGYSRKQPAGSYWKKRPRRDHNPDGKRFALEQWKVIPNYPKYQISDHGRIRGVTKILTPIPDSRGALVVSLKNHLYVTSFRIARLVGEFFSVENIAGRHPIYLDGNPANCHHTNLQWVSRSQVTGIPYSRKPKTNQ